MADHKIKSVALNGHEYCKKRTGANGGTKQGTSEVEKRRPIELIYGEQQRGEHRKLEHQKRGTKIQSRCSIASRVLAKIAAV